MRLYKPAGLRCGGGDATAQRSSDPAYDAVNAILFGGGVLIKGPLLLGLRPVAAQGDRFDEDRVGLDHLSFSVGSRHELAAP